jgi:3-oxoadipate enol-lactonase
MTSNITSTGFVGTPNSQLFFEQEGNKSGPPILFIHGLGGTTNTYQSLVPSLQEFNLIRFDFSGHGRSTVPPATTIQTYVEDCEGQGPSQVLNMPFADVCQL